MQLVCSREGTACGRVLTALRTGTMKIAQSPARPSMKSCTSIWAISKYDSPFLILFLWEHSCNTSSSSGAPQQKKHVDVQSSSRREPMKMIIGLEELSCVEWESWDVQSGQEKAPEMPNCGLLMHKGGL